MSAKEAIKRAYKKGYAAGVKAATKNKCTFGNVTIKLDGLHELDPCDFEVTEKLHNVTIEVLRCKKCGHIEISWFRQEDTEEVEVE